MKRASRSRSPAGPSPIPWIPALLFLAPFTVYLSTMGPAFLDGDSPESVAAGATLGLPHPPGYVLSVLFTRLWTLLPVGSPAFAAGVGAAFWGSLGVLLFYRTLLGFLRDLPHGKGFRGPLFAAPAALLLAFAPTYWQEALSQKGGVYLLQSALLLGFLQMWTRARNSNGPAGPFLAGNFLFLLGFANHWQTQSLFVPIWALFLWEFRGFFRSWGIRLLVPCAVPLALSPLLYLPLRARLDPELALGAPDRLSRFLDYVTRKVYFITGEHAFFSGWTERAPYLLGHVLGIGGWPLLLLALVGLALARKGPSGRTLRRLLLPLALLGSALLVLPTAPRHYGVLDNFLLPTDWILGFFAAFGAFLLTERLPALSAKLLALVFCSLPAAFLLQRYPSQDLQRAVWSYDYGTNLLKSAPRNTLLFAESDPDYFPLYYLQLVEGKRPDVRTIPSFLLFEPWGVEHFRRRDPHPGPNEELPADPIGRLSTEAHRIVQANRERTPLALSFPQGAFHLYSLPSRPADRYRDSGLLALLDGPPVQKGPFLPLEALRLRHAVEAWRRNGPSSLKEIRRIYEFRGIRPPEAPIL